jgi:hypothetical protein
MFEEYGDIVTVKDICEILMISKNIAYELLCSGRIKTMRIEKTWKIQNSKRENTICNIPIIILHITGTNSLPNSLWFVPELIDSIAELQFAYIALLPS